MSTKIFISLITVVLMATSSCKSKEQRDAEKYMSMIQQAMNDNTPKQGNDKAGTSAIPQDMKNIVGEWELVSWIVDTNDNMEIDEEERPKLKPVMSKDYMKLNSDGSGLFTVAEMEGRYEITDGGSRGKKRLTWYDKANGPHKVGTIIKVTKEELHIKEPGGWGLFLWKRL
jgi:hypothetical protein